MAAKRLPFGMPLLMVGRMSGGVAAFEGFSLAPLKSNEASANNEQHHCRNPARRCPTGRSAFISAIYLLCP